MKVQSKLIALLFIALPFSVNAQNARQWAEEFIPIHEKAEKIPLSDKKVKAAKDSFGKMLKAMEGEESLQQKLTGALSAGFNADNGSAANGESNDKTLYKFNSALKLNRGTYPGEIEFNSQFSVTMNDGKFSENLSNFKLSFDHYFHTWLEGFVFADRFSDEVLSIDQRYEVGGGIVLDLNPLDLLRNDAIGLLKDGKKNIGDLMIDENLIKAIKADDDSTIEEVKELLKEYYTKNKIAVDNNERIKGLDAKDVLTRLNTMEKLSNDITSGKTDEFKKELKDQPDNQKIIKGIQDKIFSDLDERIGILSKVKNEEKNYFRELAIRSILGSDKEPPDWFEYYLSVVPNSPKDPKDKELFDGNERTRIKKTLSDIRNRRKTVIHSIRKRYSRLRLGLLIGAFGELENATITKDNSKVNLPGKQNYRWQIRPTIHAQFTEELSLRVDYYFKEPFRNDYDKALSLKEGGRTDLQITFEAKIKESLFGQAGNVTMGLKFNRLYDEAPPFIKVDEIVTRARRMHDRAAFTIGIEL